MMIQIGCCDCMQNDIFNDQPQIKLSELSVYNWGSFHGVHTAKIHPDGTLITGDNGAGKSTLIDGLMALLEPAGKASFNIAAAQGDRSDRSLLTYMRGSFGSAEDGSRTKTQSKRNQSVVTGLRALYQFSNDAEVTLCALFWTNQSTHSLSDVNKLYIVAKRNLTLTELLEQFGDGDVRKLRAYLRNDSRIAYSDVNFSEYQTMYRDVLMMENKNAPSLLSRALGLKKVDDLTALIRNLVLEPTDLQSDAKEIVANFNDLKATYEELQDTKNQQDHLKHLPKHEKERQRYIEQVGLLKEERQALPIYYSKIQVKQLSEKLLVVEADKEQIEETLKDNGIRIKSIEQSIHELQKQYYHLGGNEIEKLEKDLERLKQSLEVNNNNARRYQGICRTLELSETLSFTQLESNQAKQAAHHVILKEQLDVLETQFNEISGKTYTKNEVFQEVRTEIKEITQLPDSNIPVNFQKMRLQLVESLDLKLENCPFIGELIDVKAEDKQWQGAIERALGGIRTTLLISDRYYPDVVKWLNHHYAGLHVRVQSVKHEKIEAAQFIARGFLRKLEWKQHPYRDWLKSFLAKFDLTCVDSVNEFEHIEFAITKEGGIQKEKGRFEKKDLQKITDRRTWCLGFNNKSRLESLEEVARALSTELVELQNAQQQLNHNIKILEKKKSEWQRLLEFQWREINVPELLGEQQSIQKTLVVLKDADGDLAKINQKLSEKKADHDHLVQQKEHLLGEKGKIENKIQSILSEQVKHQALSEELITEDVEKRIIAYIGEQSFKGSDDRDRIGRQYEEKLADRMEEISRLLSTINRVMDTFRGKDKWQYITNDWPTDVDGLQYFLEYLAKLDRENLPALRDKFKARLTRHATQSLANFMTKMDSSREEIADRIKTINSVLKRTEFKEGSYLRLESKKDIYPHVIDFEKLHQKILNESTSDDHEKRYLLLQELVDILDKAANSNTLESLRLLDTRYQLSFIAKEIDQATEEVLDVLESSSGKSGGEKEAFAGTIVAASLAYVLTPEGFDRPAYSTVFLDEAFSNTAEAVSRRVLRVFKALNIHVNLITPYKNITVAREAANSLLIIERDNVAHESRLCEVTWQEVDAQLLAKHGVEIVR